MTIAASVEDGRFATRLSVNQQDHEHQGRADHARRAGSATRRPRRLRSATPTHSPGSPGTARRRAFAAPRATISWSVSTGSPAPECESPSTGWRCRPGSTKAIPAAATASGRGRASSTSGSVGDGNPDGIGPTTATPCRVRSNGARTAAAPTAATRIPGTFGTRAQHEDDGERRDADRQRGVTVLPSRTPSTNARLSSTSPSALVEKPKSRGQLADEDHERDAVQEAGAHGLREELGEDAEAAKPATMQIAPMRSASIPASATAFVGSPSAPTSGRIDAAISGTEHGVGPEHEDPRRAEHGVRGQHEDRGVEAGDRREPASSA